MASTCNPADKEAEASKAPGAFWLLLLTYLVRFRPMRGSVAKIKMEILKNDNKIWLLTYIFIHIHSTCIYCHMWISWVLVWMHLHMHAQTGVHTQHMKKAFLCPLLETVVSSWPSGIFQTEPNLFSSFLRLLHHLPLLCPQCKVKAHGLFMYWKSQNNVGEGVTPLCTCPY